MSKRTLLIPVALISAGLVAAGCGDDSTPAQASKPASTPAKTTAQQASTDGKVAVDLNEWEVTPSATDVKAGKVTFAVTNSGKLPHEMVIVRTDEQADSLGKGSTVSEKGAVGEVEDVEAGGSKGGSFDLKPGHYALICNINGHYVAGMHADLTVS